SGAEVAAPKTAARGIYAAPRRVRDMLDRYLDDAENNWSFAQIAGILRKKAGYKMSVDSISRYRRNRDERAAGLGGRAASGRPVLIEITLPPGARLNIRKLRNG